MLHKRKVQQEEKEYSPEWHQSSLLRIQHFVVYILTGNCLGGLGKRKIQLPSRGDMNSLKSHLLKGRGKT
jgi:hypothetical protein